MTKARLWRASNRKSVYGEGAVEQAKRLIEAQLVTPAPPLASAIPAGTKLRTLFLTAGGDAYVDLTASCRRIIRAERRTRFSPSTRS